MTSRIVRAGSLGSREAARIIADAIADARSGDVEGSPIERAFLRGRATVATEVVAHFAAMLYLSIFAQVGLSKTAGKYMIQVLVGAGR